MSVIVVIVLTCGGFSLNSDILEAFRAKKMWYKLILPSSSHTGITYQKQNTEFWAFDDEIACWISFK